MDTHIDLIRNDWANRTQVSVAHIHLATDGFGLIVKDTTSDHFENNIFDALGDDAKGTSDAIKDALHRVFRGPYLVVSDEHGADECPFARGPIAIGETIVDGEFVLPDL